MSGIARERGRWSVHVGRPSAAAVVLAGVMMLCVVEPVLVGARQDSFSPPRVLQTLRTKVESAHGDGQDSALTVLQTTYGELWVSPLSSPTGWKLPDPNDQTRDGAVPEGTCPIVSGLDPVVTPISLVIGTILIPFSTISEILTPIHACDHAGNEQIECRVSLESSDVLLLTMACGCTC